jgi:hypothetical protein
MKRRTIAMGLCLVAFCLSAVLAPVAHTKPSAQATSTPLAVPARLQCPSFNHFIHQAAWIYRGTRNVHPSEIRHLKRLESCASVGGRAVDTVNWRIDRKTWAYRRWEEHVIYVAEKSPLIICILGAESTSSPTDLHVPPDTGTDQNGIAQWSNSTWTTIGGGSGLRFAPTPDQATPIQQLDVLETGIAAGGSSNWTPYDHCTA